MHHKYITNLKNRRKIDYYHSYVSIKLNLFTDQKYISCFRFQLRYVVYLTLMKMFVPRSVGNNLIISVLQFSLRKLVSVCHPHTHAHTLL